ncbi:hypothetical protein QAD02_010096 [Eretmocerus hayati]|uniref:Uncharacterized protein n=1 Tax=Eretmocerus hayati TaxID=131215 RepID=A0ACC2NCC7_9HYME|nr:hypothetical protein QAD02_010096 [Eretmocerus hayati]
MDGDPTDIGALTMTISVLYRQYTQIAMLQYEKEDLRRRLLYLLGLYDTMVKVTECTRNRTMWTRPVFSEEERLRQGDSSNLIELLRRTDSELYYNYLRMSYPLFQELLNLVSPLIKKQRAVREPIPAETRLQLTLRYLASGSSQIDIAYAFRVSPSAVCNIVEEVCEALWTVLKERELKVPTRDEWYTIAQELEQMTDYPHFLGGLDGKQVVIEAPPHSGSAHYNYKGSHSINLTAVASSHYRFTLVEIGAEGRRCDGGVFEQSSIRYGLDNDTLNIPPPSMRRGYVLPFVFLADEAYPLRRDIMRPWSRRLQLTLMQIIFNLRQGIGRRVVECTFGIFAARWRIFRKPIIAYVEKVEKFVKACVVLHNFIINKEIENGSRRYRRFTQQDRDLHCDGLRNMDRVEANLGQDVTPFEYREICQIFHE